MSQDYGTMEEFCRIIAALRGENGCPWDRAQTLESLKPCMINEMTEALAAVDIYRSTGDAGNLCEELGDVLLQVVMQAAIAEEKGLFTISDVIRGVSEKMIRRHPHVFGEESAVAEAQEVPGRWEAIKKAEKKGRSLQQEEREKEAFANAAREVIAHLDKKI